MVTHSKTSGKNTWEERRQTVELAHRFPLVDDKPVLVSV